MSDSIALLSDLEQFGTRLGLAGVRSLLSRLGHPERRLDVVLVAGTNGKGSTAALLSSVASAAGYRTGLYTSPHLESVRERIRVDGVAIDRDRLQGVLAAVLDAAEGSSTYFEVLTAAALVEFAEREVELAVLEVGLGGRLDATNVCDPVLSLITEIGLDHQEHLGSSTAEIAAEKAGVLRADVPGLARVSDPEARASLERRARELGTEMRFVDESARSLGRESVELELGCRYRLQSSLVGRHQLGNVALAVAAAESLGDLGWSKIDRVAIERGVSGSRWPGRLEWVEAGSGRVLLDGAHNPDAAEALASHLREFVGDYTLVFGALGDKDVEGMLAPLARSAAQVVLTRVRSPRAVEPVELEVLVPGAAEVVARPIDAVLRALESALPVVVCGSLYLVGEVRSELRRRYGVPEGAADLATYVPR